VTWYKSFTFSALWVAFSLSGLSTLAGDVLRQFQLHFKSHRTERNIAKRLRQRLYNNVALTYFARRSQVMEIFAADERSAISVVSASLLLLPLLSSLSHISVCLQHRLATVMLTRTGHARTRTRTSLTVTYCKLQLNLPSLSSNNNEHKSESSQHMTVKPITLNN